MRTGRSDPQAPPVAARIARLLEEVIRSRAAGGGVVDDEVIAAHSELMPELGEKLRALRLVEEAARLAEITNSSLTGSAEGSPAVAVGDATQLADASTLPSDSFAGYQLLREIHRGGQGVVYQAIQKSTKRKVAIKVMKEGPFAGPGDRARFEREVQILAQLQHPNIVAVHDSGSAAGAFYFVMDYIAGQSLDVYMASGPRTINETLVLFAKICGAVDAAHLRGIIHRDLKPSNIRVDADGEPRILDFGLAKLATPLSGPADGGLAVMTMTGQFVGSLPWASPEQAEGIPSKVDIRTDVYSLGVILYQMLTGKFPYEVVGSMRDVLDRIIRAAPARPSSVRKQINDEIDTIALKCLAKERERRYQSAGELARDIENYLAGAPIDAKRDSALYILKKHVWRYRLLLGIALGFMLLVLGSAIVAWQLYARSQATLWDSYLAQARAQRFSGRPGRRVEALAAIENAVSIRNSAELRNEAIAALALTDVRIQRTWPSPWKGTYAFCEFDPSLTEVLVAPQRGKTLSVQRVRDGAEVFQLPELGAHDSTIEPRLSADGRFVARGVVDGVEIWDLVEHKLTHHVPLQATRFLSPLAFSPDGRALFIGMQDGAIARYDLDAQRIARFPAGSAPVHRVAVSPDNRRLASASTKSKDVVIRDAESGEVLRTLPHSGVLWSIAWGPDGSLLAAGGEDYAISVWDAAGGNRLFSLTGHVNVPIRLAFDSAGAFLLSAGWDSTTRLWDLHTADQVLVLPLFAYAFQAASSEFGFGAGWAPTTLGIGEVIRSDTYRELGVRRPDGLRARCRGVATSPDGRLAASTAGDGWWLFDLATGSQIAFVAGSASLDDLEFDPSGRAVYTASESGVQRWALERQGQSLRVGAPVTLLAAHGGESPECAATHDGRMVVGSASDGYVYARDAGGAGDEMQVGQHTGASTIAVSADGRWAASGANHGRDVKVWDLAARILVQELSIPRAANAAFSPDGRWLVTSEAEEHVFWETQTWRAAVRLPRGGNTHLPSCIAFSPDGSLVATMAGPGIIRLVAMRTFAPVADLECPYPMANMSFAFSLDGGTIVADNTVRGAIQVWDLRALRRRLAELHLDWDLPPYPPAVPQREGSITVEIDTGASRGSRAP